MKERRKKWTKGWIKNEGGEGWRMEWKKENGGERKKGRRKELKKTVNMYDSVTE